MTHGRILAMLVALTALVPLAGAHEPVTDTITQGEVKTYPIDHQGEVCLQVITTWTVTLTHTPTTDTLILVVSGHGAQRTEGGFAQISWVTPTSCDAFVVHVIGASVQDVATFTLDVAHGGGGGGEPI